ncbi:hypothetical protein D6D19_05739 [Aureobasidium pullulans]|nr:hypothetical protein D6D29_09611 [Aureobasidium pullulans]THW73338.1 hypothetical protein D6D19_05739 [Aureobasidium pullulans]THY00516.1 hypothetical protein D6D02_08874 [Aureobasidium pullulans]THZ37374.1 hypothetical protein D6C90_06728 [Aureobasidium pullulans]
MTNHFLSHTIQSNPIQSSIHNPRNPQITMPHTKTPGGSGMSEKEQKKQAQTHGTGADNAPGHTELKAPGEAPVASDSGVTRVGIDNGTNQPGEKGIGGVPVSNESTTNANMK